MVEKECPESRIVVVGNKSDLRGLKTSYIPEDYAQSELTEKYPYLECSAKTREGVVQAFEKSIRLVLRKDQKRKSKCHLI
jgi:GTPase SAR1 family protein